MLSIDTSDQVAPAGYKRSVRNQVGAMVIQRKLNLFGHIHRIRVDRLIKVTMFWELGGWMGNRREEDHTDWMISWAGVT